MTPSAANSYRDPAVRFQPRRTVSVGPVRLAEEDAVDVYFGKRWRPLVASRALSFLRAHDVTCVKKSLTTVRRLKTSFILTASTPPLVK